jgi:hypothetical protein
VVFKHAQVSHLVGEEIGDFRAVLLTDTDKHAQAAPDLTDDLPIHRNSGL